jgi:hypothetical protein
MLPDPSLAPPPPCLASSPLSSSISQPKPATPSLSLGLIPPGGVIHRDLNVVEVGLLKLASATGSLEDVHQILSRYICTQTPDPTTGRLWLSLFHESITEAIANNHSVIVSYLFFMRVGEPSLYVKSALSARSSTIFQVFLDHGWNINESIERTMAPALGWVLP